MECIVLGISAKDLVSAVTDERTQRLVAAAAQAYAPEQSARVQSALTTAQQNYRQAKAILAKQPPPTRPRPIMLPQQLMPPLVPDGDGGMMPASGPVQKSNILTFAIMGGAALLVFLVLSRK
jgi:hypothetical protein